MDFKISGVRENNQYLEKAIDYFAEKWSTDRRVYVFSGNPELETN